MTGKKTTTPFFDHVGSDYYVYIADGHDAVTPEAAYAMFWETVAEEGHYLAELLKGRDVQTVLDCACGVGTQALGLAQHGYHLTASDISAEFVQEAERNAKRAGLEMSFAIASMDALSAPFTTQFDAVLCAGDGLPHMKTREGIKRALLAMTEQVRPGGWLLIGINDYVQIKRDKPRFFFRRLCEGKESRKLFIFLADYPSEDIVVANLLHLHEVDGSWKELKHIATPKYMLDKPQLEIILEEIGYAEMIWNPHRWGWVIMLQKLDTK